ncbi:DUF3667 domain-containing protein [Fulvivirga ulvae]|uniref:DUF3667 domain-containing protein n=1 Tax=Fulvivirga ulvae TaxID=2904245 RepID=UPI001F1FAF3C|nr:DUF3667 domain-containing protein [Fulvivirga ulvae]UII30270.1 DUF3667 domain-containing protein [Fulvivirga ulvae]
MALSHCINCSAEVNATYCCHCGQKVDVNRLKWKVLLSELNQRVLGLDNRFARTIKDLTVRPGKVVRSFIDGNRVKYINPVGYLFILSTVYVLFISILNIDMVEFTKDIGGMFQNEKSQEIEAEGFQRMLMGNMKIMSFTLIPFFAMAAYVVFRKKGYNLLETSVLVFYTHAHPLVLSFIALFVYKFSGVSGNNYIFPVTILYFAFACSGFYQGNKVLNFTKGLLSYLLGFLFFGFVIFIFVILLAAIDMESFESLFPRKH